MTIDEINILNKKAEIKKDGIYSFRGNLWVVKSNKFIAYLDNRGIFLQRFGSFNAEIGDLSSIERYYWKDKVKEWFKKQ